MRFIFYSHDGVGLGHARRNLALADAVMELHPEAAVLIATGVESIRHLGIPRGVGVLTLPRLRKLSNEVYTGRDLSISLADHVAVRSALLKAAVESFRPDVLLADKHPFGVGEELVPALEVVRANGGRTVLGLRDILDTRETVLREWARRDLANRIPQYYDRVLVYGKCSVFDPIAAYEFPPSLAERTVFCGYVVNRTRREWRAADAMPELSGRRPAILATAGGGQDGIDLIRCFLTAAAGAGWDAIVVTGPQTSEHDRKTLRAHADDVGVTFRSFVPCLFRWFERVDAIVSMGGYNTMVEALASGTPTVCVPRVAPRMEQLLRARAFARLGLLQLLDPGRLEPLALREEIQAALECSREREELKRRAQAALGFDGAENGAVQLTELAAEAASSLRGSGASASSLRPGAA